MEDRGGAAADNLRAGRGEGDGDCEELVEVWAHGN